MKKVGILTGGGDCPGLNGVIRATVRRAQRHDIQVIGIKNGWAGLVHGLVEPLTSFSVSGILPRGGTILGTSRTNPFKQAEDEQRLFTNLKRFGLDAIVAVGGEDTLGVALKLHERGVNIVGVPKTIDNDLAGTDQTFGFDTAISIVAEALDRLHTTAESHQRVMVLEVMGRHAGWIAALGGMAGGADFILVPEHPVTIADIVRVVDQRTRAGKTFSIIVVAEGAKLEGEAETVTQDAKVDAFGHVRLGGIGTIVADRIEAITGHETRVTILGHVQRGGSPTAFDRVLATRFGVKATDLVAQNHFGVMVALRGMKIVPIPLADALGYPKLLDDDIFDTAATFFE